MDDDLLIYSMAQENLAGHEMQEDDDDHNSRIVHFEEIVINTMQVAVTRLVAKQ